MPRFHLIFSFLFFIGSFHAQSPVMKYIAEGNKLFLKGDYHYALDFFEKAYAIDSNSVELLWNMALTYKAYKEYRKAEDFFQVVYTKEEGLLYPSSLLELGLMQKMNEKYDLAIETFKTAKKKYSRNKKDYLYEKSKREIESCLFARNELINNDLVIQPFSDLVNSKDTEFGHVFTDDDRFIFSSMRGDSVSEQEEVYSKDYRTRLYIYDDKDSSKPIRLIRDLLFEKQNTGNGCFSVDGKRFYFSLCGENLENYTCKIMVAGYEDGRWTSIDSLGNIINSEGANTTMPNIGVINGVEHLFFASNKDGGEGGMDLYYSIIKNGNQYSEPKTIKTINSKDSELSPFYDTIDNRLYFSSSWYNGLGGYDVFYSPYVEGKFQSPINAGMPINSAANDLYYFKKEDKQYVSSNRIGVKYSKNPTCCSDIFEISPKPPMVDTNIVVSVKETLEELNKRLPVTLYFHNDEPNPRSLDTVTKVNYLKSYSLYRDMLEKYQEEYSKGLRSQAAEDAKEDIESFFIEYVDQGVRDLYQFRDLLLEELQKGKKINVTIKGFASPLAKSDYNVNLTKRRISSLQNYLLAFQDSVFAPYFFKTAPDGGELLFSEVPFGEDQSSKLVSDNINDQKNSVYSRAAGLERKIEVQSVRYIKEPDTIQALRLPKLDTNVIDLGKIKKSEKVTAIYTLTNDQQTDIEIEGFRIPCNCSEGKISKTTLQPGEKATIEFLFDPSEYEGKIVKSIYLKIKDQPEEIRLILVTEVLGE